MPIPRRNPWVLRAALPLLALLGSTPGAFAAERPSLVNTRISTPFGANGHSSTLDGRVFVGNIREDQATTTTTWQARVFRPEAVTYDAQGKPGFAAAFSPGRTTQVTNGENALAFCFGNAAQPYFLSGGLAIYQPYLFDSQMFNGPNRFRRRTVDLRVSQPFTAQADISSFTTGPVEYLTTVTGASLRGIEPTMTSDGRLLIFQGGPNNDGAIDHLVYAYNATPCAATGWSTPRPLSMMFSDTNPGVKRYPLSWQKLKAATGELFGETTSGALVRGAYAWVDHEGRNVTYTGVIYTDGARREAVSLIGADTNWTAYHIDGAINTDRSDIAHLFYSGPMWNFEQERAPEQNFPAGSNNDAHYLPVTKTHDVLALFGSNTADYNEVDIGELVDPFHVLSLPMNELVTRAGAYDLTRTPDLSGRFFTGTLVGTASISASNAVTQASSGSLWEPHGKGKALVLPGGGALGVTLADATGTLPGVGAFVRGFTVQLAVKPDATIHQGCTTGNPYRYLVQKSGALDLIYEVDDTVQMSFVINGQRVRLGRSPALPVGAWSHLAYTWDGVTGAFGEYVNGVPTGRVLPVAPGTFRLGTGALAIGAGTLLNTEPCPANGEGSFRGAIDEVRFFSHARSARSVCMTSPGADCRGQAIQETPSAGQFGMSQQQPACNTYAALGSLACASAMHRVCAQRGASDALATSTNTWQTIQQLIGNRPPISLLGALAAATSTDVSVACGPIQHESLGVTFEELTRFHAGCVDERVSQGFDCQAAVHRFCNSLGWTTGQLFEMTSRPWAGCFNAGLIQDVPKDQLGPASNSGAFGATDSKLEVSRWCQARGYGAGVVQELGAGTLANVHCFQPAVTVPWKLNP
ncbi:LamG domain-containing protein [Myxococcus sp. K15C18031901]|uniref:LamG domain-containing protein n=1 Tax=Myxococcus dinghuensis TaxID=2906761 RepID=UPI0020A75E37|nr:LamG domain-containing protein [Myxococcus dinghuensis]MCP3101503.1 LamG domain-containing protein [Myxococcus dinghuensis]